MVAVVHFALPTSGFSIIKPLKVQLSAGEQKVTEVSKPGCNPRLTTMAFVGLTGLTIQPLNTMPPLSMVQPISINHGRGAQS